MYNGYSATERAKIVCGRVQVVNINTLDYPVSSRQNKIRQYVFSKEIAKINLRQYFMLYGMSFAMCASRWYLAMVNCRGGQSLVQCVHVNTLC